MSELEFDPQTTEELFKEANSLVGNVPLHLKRSIWLYFIARYINAAFTAWHDQLPAQILNEFRSAPDHLFRDITENEGKEVLSKTSDNIKKAELHLQRAALDASKLHAKKTSENVEKYFNTYIKGINKKAWDSYNKGEFSKTINDDLNSAKKSFEKARIGDNKLGSDYSDNDKVITMYIDAFFLYKKVQQKLNDESLEINKLSNSFDSYKRGFSARSFLLGIVASLVASFIFNLRTKYSS